MDNRSPASKAWLLFLLPVLAMWLVLFQDSFLSLFRFWSTEDYSYCWLVPPIAIYLAYLDRKELAANSAKSSLAGYLVLILAMVLFFVGKLGSLEILVFSSIWLSIVSVVFLLAGAQSLLALRFPLFVLLFAVPAPPLITRTLTFNLRLLSSTISTKTLQMLGITAFQEGNVIDVGFAQLQVVDACSGLRYLMPMVLVALIMGQLFHRKNLWQRALLLLFSIPISVLVNSIRIVALVLGAKSISPTLIEEGFAHDFSGWAIFILSTILLFSISHILVRLSMKRRTPQRGTSPDAALPEQSQSGVSVFGRRTGMHSAIVSAVLLICFIAQAQVVSGMVKPERRTFADFPMRIGEWEGERTYLSEEILSALWADDYVSGTLRNKATGNILELLVSYYGYQTTLHTAHAPTSCILGGGWKISGRRVLEANLQTGRNFPVQQMLLEKGNQRIISSFWFQQRGRVITSEYQNKFYLLWDGLMRRRTDGALVRMEMVLLPGQTIEEAQVLMDSCLVDLKQILNEYIPD